MTSTATTTIMPLFTITAKKSLLDDLTLYEKVDKVILNKLINSSLLKKTFHNKYASRVYHNEKEQLTAYMAKMKYGKVKVTYNKNKNNKYGRSNPDKALGLFCIRREIRHTLCGDSMADIDVNNCHPVILNQLCENENIDHYELNKYVKNRDDYFTAGMDAYGCSREDIKVLFIIYCYGGGIKKWIHNREIDITKCSPEAVYNGSIIEIPIMKQFHDSMANIHMEIGKKNQELCSIVIKNKNDNNITEFNLWGTVCSFVLQEYECRMLEAMYKYLIKNKIVLNELCVLCADGLMIDKKKYTPDLLHKLKDVIKTEVGFDVDLTQKEMNSGYLDILDDNIIAKADLPVEIPQGVYEGDDENAATIILTHYPHWKCCNNTLYVFDDKTGMWSDAVDIQNNVITRYSEYLNIIKEGPDGVIKKTGRNYAKNNQKRKDIYPFIREKCVDNDWVLKTETTSLGKILFNNGHYDFIRGLFITGHEMRPTDIDDVNTINENGYNPDIVFFYRIGHNFTSFTDDELEYMASIEERLFINPLGSEVGQYLIRNLSRALAGDVMKKIMFGLGRSNTGKGILTKACQLSMQSYCGVFTGENLSYNNSSNDEAQKMRWAMLLRNKRLIISNELSTTKPLDSVIIRKLMSGGDTLTGRKHGELETEFKPQYLALVLANDMPEIKPVCPATRKRTDAFTYYKSFVDNPTNEYELQKDHNLDNEMKTELFQRCFIGILIRSYLNFNDGGRIDTIPNDIIQAQNDWLGTVAESDFMMRFLENYEITDDPINYINAEELKAWNSTLNAGVSYKKFIIELKMHCKMKGKTNVISDRLYLDGVKGTYWYGIKII